MNYKHILKVYQWSKNEYSGFEASELWESESGKSYTNCQYPRNKNGETSKINGVWLYSQCNLYGDNRNMYAMDVRMRNEVTMRDIEQCERDIKRIKTIEKKYISMCNRLGYPGTFTQFVAYIADIIGADIVETSYCDGNEVMKLELYELKSREDKMTSNKGV